MKSAIFAAAIALAVPAVYAQVTGLPECAGPCLMSSLAMTTCSQSDLKCVCSSPAFLESAKDCLQKACSAAERETAVGAAYKLCQSYGVTIPTDLPGPTTSAPAVASTTVAPGTSTGVSTIDTSAPVETPYPYPGTTTTLTTFTTTVIGTGTGSMTPTGNSSTPTVAPPPSNSEGAAVKNIASFGAMAMAVAGLFAL